MPKKEVKPKYVTAKQVRTHPKFELTRQNNAEFGRAGKANSLLRRALRVALFNVADRYVSGRLTKPMMKILQSDPVNGRGDRRVTMGHLSILEGFNFNRATGFQQVCFAPYSVNYNPATGQVDIDIPLLIPRSMIHGPAGTGAFSIIGAAAAIDLEGYMPEHFEPVQTEIYDAYHTERHTVHLSLQVPANTPHPVIVCLGIEFYGEGRGLYTVMDKKVNAMAVVKVFK